MSNAASISRIIRKSISNPHSFDTTTEIGPNRFAALFYSEDAVTEAIAVMEAKGHQVTRKLGMIYVEVSA